MKKLLQWPKNKLIIAIDFDGTITERDNRVWEDNHYTNDVYTENKSVTEWVKRHRDSIYLILWTCRCGKALQDATDYCKSIGIMFDAVNENIVCYESSRKVMADLYIDDKSVLPDKLQELTVC